MTLNESLIELGWHLSQEGIDSISENGQVQDVNILSKKALDFDLRDIGDSAFPEDFSKDPSKLEKQIIVQIQKIRNVSAPKANEESTSAPRMLKLTIHDGKTICTALEISSIASLSINTPPGTKILLKHEGLEACHGIIWLTPAVIQVLGGQVPHMIEKWELNRSLAKHTRGGIGADGGPPPWIPFGQELEAVNVDKQFKSLQEAAKQDNAEFEAQRKGAIAEAQRLSGVKKVFGGGTKPLLDANVQKIIDAGFTEEQAENALKYTKNNVDRALRMLQKRDNSENRKEKQKEPEPKRKGRNKESTEDDGIPVKPSGKVSLFDFLEDKLPNVTERDKSSRQMNNSNAHTEEKTERNERNYQNKEKTNLKNNTRNQASSRYDNNSRHRSENRAHYSNDHSHTSHRDERKYQSQEKPPRFQKKFEEKNKQHQQHQTNSYNSQYNSYQQQGYDDRHARGDRSMGNSKGHQNYHNPNTMDSIVDATANMVLTNQHQQTGEEMQRNYHQHHEQYPQKQYVNQSGPDIPPFRRANEYQRRAQQQQAHTNGYMEAQAQSQMYQTMGYGPGMSGPYGARGAYYGPRHEYGAGVSGAGGAGGAPLRAGPPAAGPFLPGSLLGFQNAAVNEQARALLAVADVNWKVGDRCLALYWEDNNFYDAEITGISANTVVVRFCAYNNHEEVLKSNCLPLPTEGAPPSGAVQAEGAAFGRRP